MTKPRPGRAEGRPPGLAPPDTRPLSTRSGAPSIVHVVPYYPPHIGGMERIAQELSGQQLASGAQVTVITTELPKGTRLGHTHSVRRLWSVEFAHTPWPPTLALHLLHIPADTVVHLHVGQAYFPELVWLAGKVRRFRYVAHFHLDVGPSGRLGRLFLIYKRVVLPRVLRGAARVIVFSEAQKALVCDRYGLAADRVVVIPNGITLATVRPTPGGSRPPERLLFVGRLSIQKRVDRLIAAMAQLDDRIRLDLVGDGEERDRLEDLATKLGVSSRVTFHGAKDRQELATFQAQADVFVMPSEREGMPLAVLEAMAHGLPVVATDVIGLRELVGGVGLLVAPSADGLAKGIGEVCNDRRLANRLAQASLERAEGLSWSKIGPRFMDLYRDVAHAG